MIPRIVFCDFDGTITERDGFVSVCRTFAPEAVETYLPGVMDGSLSLREGLTKILETIPTDQYPTMLDHCETVPIRPGLEALIDWLAEREVPFVVISGGLKGLVLRKLGPLAEKVAAVYAPDVALDGPFLKVTSDYPGEKELLAKADVMAAYTYKEAVAIGDGITDYNMATVATRVFARRQLAEYMDAQSLPFYAWTDFHAIRQTLERVWDKS
ncbi:HAD-IB family phosphatase [Desulfoluna sp.]|uniref:HAD-IB family phosphatase n=1 Tax=Desulfoluna sp. TaxID=2045199 RepID=UPI00260679C3|nr:HAD-IB family phosphatase [Desulfoluna sp.]